MILIFIAINVAFANERNLKVWSVNSPQLLNEFGSEEKDKVSQYFDSFLNKCMSNRLEAIPYTEKDCRLFYNHWSNLSWDISVYKRVQDFLLILNMTHAETSEILAYKIWEGGLENVFFELIKFSEAFEKPDNYDNHLKYDLNDVNSIAINEAGSEPFSTGINKTEFSCHLFDYLINIDRRFTVLNRVNLDNLLLMQDLSAANKFAIQVFTGNILQANYIIQFPLNKDKVSIFNTSIAKNDLEYDIHPSSANEESIFKKIMDEVFDIHEKKVLKRKEAILSGKELFIDPDTGQEIH